MRWPFLDKATIANELGVVVDFFAQWIAGKGKGYSSMTANEHG